MRNHSQVTYMPYVFMQKQPIFWDGLSLWNFELECEKRFSDQSMCEYIKKLITSNVIKGNPIKSIGVITFHNKNLQPLTLKEQNQIEQFRKVLFICSVAQNNIHTGENAGNFMVTADNFVVATQNFELGSQYTAYSIGSVVNVSTGGLKVGEVKYEKPPHVLERPLTIDDKLYKQLEILKGKKPLVFRRLIRAIDSLMSSYFNAFELSQNGRILQQAQAFEILFNLPNNNKQRMIFKEKIESHCTLPTDKKITFKSIRKGGMVDEIGTYAKQWADKFYVLRNAIIHGENVSQSQYAFHGRRHQDLAVWFFLVCLKKEINRALKAEIFYDVMEFKKGKLFYNNREIYGVLVKNFKEAIKIKNIKP